jgi:uncharacterized protein YecT (DUF1311 family)
MLLVLMCLLLPGMVSAESAEPGEPTTKPHPIDVQIDALAAKDESTMGQVQAYDEGIKLWDKELNRVYSELMKTLAKAPAAKEALKQSQRAWVQFRDKEIVSIREIYGQKEGTMFRPMAIYSVLKLTRDRARELADRLSILTEM